MQWIGTEMESEGILMWKRLKESHPWVYEAMEWAVLGLAMTAFALALAVYLR